MSNDKEDRNKNQLGDSKIKRCFTYLKEKTFALLRHPLFISLVSIYLGSYLLNVWLLKKAEYAALLEKKIAISEEVIDYGGDSIKLLSKARFILIGRSAFSNRDYNALGIKIQDMIDNNEVRNMRLQSHLVYYFDSHQPYKSFVALQGYVGKAYSKIDPMITDRERDHGKIDDVVNEYTSGIRILTGYVIWSMKGDIPIPFDRFPSLDLLSDEAMGYLRRNVTFPPDIKQKYNL